MKSNLIYLSLLMLLAIIHPHMQGMSIATIINIPGEYEFGNDIYVAPEIADDAIVIITVSNVSLNLENIILSQVNNVPGLVGILVLPGLQNIQIIGGNFLGLTGNAIIIGDGCTNVSLSSIYSDECNAGGILLDGSITGTGIIGAVINNCTVVSSTGVNGTPAYGIQINAGQTIGVTNCICNANDAGITSSGYGFMVNSSSNCAFDNCSASSNGGDAQVAGIYISQSDNCQVNNFYSFENIARGFSPTSTVFGIFLDQCNKTIIDSCKSIENVNIGLSGDGVAIGIGSSSGTNNMFSQCLSQTNTGGSLSAGFFLTNETQSSIYKCGANENLATTGTAYGIYLAGTNNNQCYLRKNFINNNSGAVNDFGIADESTASTNVVISNYAFNNGTNFSVTYPLSIVLPVTTASLSTAVPGIPEHTAGILDNVSINP